jgi:AraC-like DNA-binding protein
MSNLSIFSARNRSTPSFMADLASPVAGARIAVTSRLPIPSKQQDPSSTPGRTSQDGHPQRVLSRLLAPESENLKRLYNIAAQAGFRIIFCDETGVSVAQCCTLPAPDYVKGGLTPRMLSRVREYIEQHLADPIGLEVLAKMTGLSRCYFARAFKSSVGMAPHCFLMRCRLEHAKKLLTETNMSLARIALASGFSDQSHFSRRFRQSVGQTPRSFRQTLR